jgi:hypothetical protein
MKKLLVSLAAVVVFVGAFLAEATATYPVNGDLRVAPRSHWH